VIIVLSPVLKIRLPLIEAASSAISEYLRAEPWLINEVLRLRRRLEMRVTYYSAIRRRTETSRSTFRSSNV
jgi:hypothetical protein